MNKAGAQRFADRSRDSCISVTKRVHRYPACKIEISPAIGVDELYTFSSYQLHRRALVGGKKRGRFQKSGGLDFVLDGQCDRTHKAAL